MAKADGVREEHPTDEQTVAKTNAARGTVARLRFWMNVKSLVAAAAMERGGYVSIGLGDYPYPKLELPTNARIVSRVAQMAREMGRAIATPQKARKMLGLA